MAGRCLVFDLGKVGGKPVSRHLMLAYDDVYSIEYFGTKLRPYWRRNGMEAADLLRTAAEQYDELTKRCAAFDDELMADLTRAGGAGICRALRAGLSPGIGGQQAGRRRQRPAAAVPQGELQQRLHRHGGRDLPGGPASSCC